MIDIHSHILHGVDDGAKSLDVSLAMLEMAAASGTTDIVATPHASVEYRYHPEIVAERLRELISATSVPVNIHSGCDFHLTFDNVQDAVANPTRYTINRKRYLLVELSDMVIFKSTEPDFLRLQEAGMSLVITHPERNPLLRQRIDTIRRWVAMGCFMQVTAQSFFGRFGTKAKNFSETLLDEGLVHFVASDGHDAKHRPPTLEEAFKYVSKRRGEKSAVALFSTNPLAALNGELIPVLPLPDQAPRRKWFPAWR
ncbi:MAG: CpsB/CapC family capsule biosynthesis tyrosine phosphatase [Bryobacteraceae bacterium]